MTMTTAKFMIVTPTNPKKSSLMIVNNIASTIAPPPLSISQQIAVEQICIHQRVKGGNQLRLFSFPMFYTIQHFQIKNKRICKILFINSFDSTKIKLININKNRVNIEMSILSRFFLWRRHPDSNRGSEFCRLVP